MNCPNIAEIERLTARNKVLEDVLDAARATITAWDSGYWPQKTPLVKAIAAADKEVSDE